MVETSYPFRKPGDTNPFGATLTENQWAQFSRYLIGTGVMSVSFNDNLGELEVTAGTLPLTVDIDTGAAAIQGHYYQNNATNTLTLNANLASGIRADLIALECKWGLNAGITAIVVQGTNGLQYPSTDPRSGNPMPPQPVQTEGVRWQLPLAQVNMVNGHTTIVDTHIVDLRNFVGVQATQSNSVVVAMPNARSTMKQNADFQIPASAGFIDADEIINEAFSVLPACGGTVMLSEGDCIISDSISPVRGANLIGCGSQTTITLSGLAPAGTPMIVAGYAGATIRDMALFGGGSTSSIYTTTPVTTGLGNQGVLVTTGSVQLLNLTITGAQDYGIDVTSGATSNVVIKDCTITYAYGDGIYYQGALGIVADNKISYCGDCGIHLAATATGGAQANKFSGNLVTYCGLHGIIVDGTAAGAIVGWYNMISNNEIGQCGMAATGSPSCINLIGAGIRSTSLIGNYGWTANAPYTKYGIGISSNAVQDTRAVGNDMYDASGGTGSKDIILNGATLSGLSLNLYNSYQA